MTALITALDAQPTRPLAGRLSGGFAYRSRPVVTRGIARRDVAPEVEIAALQLETAASGQAASQHAAIGIAALSLGDTDRGVAALEEAVRQAPDDPRYLSDLSAAYLARASRTDATDAWQLALRTADRALAIAPSMGEALFNRALALNGLHLTDQARAAWLAYLKVDPDSAWGREAKELCGC
jgi:tetratricopeptide (TPR) repeat protein